MPFKLSATSPLLLLIVFVESFALESVTPESLHPEEKEPVYLSDLKNNKRYNSAFEQYLSVNDSYSRTEADHKFIQNLNFSNDLFNKYNKKNNGYLHAFINLWSDNKRQSSFFLIPGITRYQRSIMYNAGLGFRQMNSKKSHLWGINMFYDYDKKGKHSRLSEGVEFSWSYLSLYGNLYHALNSWQIQSKNDNKQEKPASGYDVKLRILMPFYPQVACAMNYFSWKGKKVDLYHKDMYSKSPNGINYSIEYRPVPLLSFSLNHSVARQKKYKSNTAFSVNIMYDFNRSLAEQTAFSLTSVKTDFSQQLFNHVERQNNVVLSMREQPLNGQPEILLPTSIVIFENQATPLTPQISNNEHEVVSYNWSSPSLGLYQADTSTPIVVAPEYNPKNSNSYPVKLTIVYANGKTSSKQTTLVVQSAKNIPGLRRYDSVFSWSNYDNNSHQNYLTIPPATRPNAPNSPVSGLSSAPPPPPSAPPPPAPPPPAVQAPVDVYEMIKSRKQANKQNGNKKLTKQQNDVQAQIVDEMKKVLMKKAGKPPSDNLLKLP
ncbi:MAG: inverse autotransporter beta domain-containing protein [Endozoicomonadaceae bacterium]|nr:inverse autotransporter beta domain-containing protein [Endozoicomonadaceae bacterium]